MGSCFIKSFARNIGGRRNCGDNHFSDVRFGRKADMMQTCCDCLLIREPDE
jgi:hypothetical protein